VRPRKKEKVLFMEVPQRIERENWVGSAMWINICLLLLIFVTTQVRAQAPMPVTPNVGREKPLSVPTVDREGSQSVPTAPMGQSNGYLIGPDDVLSVYIVDVPELSREYRVDPTGSVTLPILSKPVSATGLTPTQFSDLLCKELKAAGLVSDPHITTSVTQSRLHAVAITGSVKKPQVYPVFTHTTLLDLLSEAEGLADDAGNTAIVRRGDVALHNPNLNPNLGNTQGPGQSEPATSVTVDLKKLIETGDPSLNVDIYPGDRVTIPRAAIIYVVGAVNKPGGFAMRQSSHSMTVLQALALAEDTKSTAKRDQSFIIRNDPQSPNGRKQIPVDLKKILSGKSSDTTLQAEDILFVPDSSGKRALHRGLESILQAATGVTIYSARF
jgi:polysaccharide biosynthesis/export protein